jgi:hypothetical protein
LLACLLACFSVTAFSAVSAAYEAPDKEEIQRSAQELVERVHRMDIKFEKDDSGRLTRIISEGVAKDIVYDANGKIDGFTTNGATTKARMAIDIKGNPVLRIFDSKGNELRPVDLKSIGLPSSFIDSVSGNKVLPTADMIDVKEFARMESQRANSNIAYLLSNKASRMRTGPLVKSEMTCTDNEDAGTTTCIVEGTDTGTGNGGQNDGANAAIRERVRLCGLQCDNTRNIGINDCDYAASVRQGVCAAGGLLFAETGPGAAAFVIVCLISSASDTNSCKNNSQNNFLSCATSCR